MTRYIAAVALALLVSCQSPVIRTVSSAGLPEVSSLGEAWAITASLVYDGSPDCRAPSTTYRLGRGDCKDAAALLVALLAPLDVDAYIIIIDTPAGRHAAVAVSGYGYIEPQVVGLAYPADIVVVATLTLGEYMEYV